jgi:excinuclease UvrABC nuclease subunit
VEWTNPQRFTLTRTSVTRNVPEESGVYGLCNPGRWIYIGHSSNIRKAMLEYLSGQMPYVLQWQPRHFTFELIPYKERASRHKELVAQYQPVCNRKTQPLTRSS